MQGSCSGAVMRDLRAEARRKRCEWHFGGCLALMVSRNAGAGTRVLIDSSSMAPGRRVTAMRPSRITRSPPRSRRGVRIGASQSNLWRSSMALASCRCRRRNMIFSLLESWRERPPWRLFLPPAVTRKRAREFARCGMEIGDA